MSLINHPSGNYSFLPGIAPYSGGVVSGAGFEIVHVTCQHPLPLCAGFDRIAQYLDAQGRPKAALCGIELRSPRPFTFAGFAEFNKGYAAILDGWGLFVNGVNPVARTNVAPAVTTPAELVVYGFSYTRTTDKNLPPTFVVAGGGELPEGVLARESIIAVDDTSRSGLEKKARFVMDLMENRLYGLGVGWAMATAVDVYTVHSIDPLLPAIILGRTGDAAIHGVHWYLSRPPIEAIEYEMDVRGVRTEIRLS